MFIVSKDRKSIINLEQVTTMYIGSDNCSIKAEHKGGGCQLGRYNSEIETLVAMEILANRMENKKVCFMPSNDDVKNKINNEEQKWHHATGKKTKGHGGS